MKWSAWASSDGGNTFVPGETAPDRDPGARLLNVFDAESWNEAMGKYYEWQGWKPYKPMLDENGNEYPEDNLPFTQSTTQR